MYLLLSIEDAPAAAGRPDVADLEVAYSLGEKIAEKMVDPVEASIESKPLKFGDKYEDRAGWVGERLKKMIMFQCTTPRSAYIATNAWTSAQLKQWTPRLTPLTRMHASNAWRV